MLQIVLSARPGAGIVVPGAGGLRKLRLGAEGRGKRGGIRVFYYWHPPTDQILLLFAFAKNERSDLNPRQREGLRKLIAKEYP